MLGSVMYLSRAAKPLLGSPSVSAKTPGTDPPASVHSTVPSLLGKKEAYVSKQVFKWRVFSVTYVYRGTSKFSRRMSLTACV